MRVECDKCGRWFDDEFRSWNCPHRRINPGLSVDLDPPEDPRQQWTPLYSWRDGAFALLVAVVILAAVAVFVLAWQRT